MRKTIICILGLASAGLALPVHAQALHAQNRRDLHRAVDAAIASDIARDRQAERDAKRQPYVSPGYGTIRTAAAARRSEEHTSELQSLMRNSYAVFCLKKKNTPNTNN